MNFLGLDFHIAHVPVAVAIVSPFSSITDPEQNATFFPLFVTEPVEYNFDIENEGFR